MAGFRRRLEERGWHWLARAITGLVLVFLLAPILVVIPISFTAGSQLVFPMPGWSIRWYLDVLGSQAWRDAAAKAVCLGEALRPEFKVYGQAVLANARALAASLMERGIEIVTGGTDTPPVLMDVGGLSMTGDEAEKALEAVGITCNKNPAPFDAPRPSSWRGVRLGVCAVTTRGFGEQEMRDIAGFIAAVLHKTPGVDVARHTGELCARFPIYQERCY